MVKLGLLVILEVITIRRWWYWNKQTPVQVDKINNLKEVSIVCSHSDVGRLYMLQDNGEFLNGYSSYGGLANPIHGTNWTGEDGTYKLFHTYIPLLELELELCTAKVLIIHQTTTPQMMVGTDDGQVLLWGYSNNNNLGRNYCDLVKYRKKYDVECGIGR